MKRGVFAMSLNYLMLSGVLAGCQPVAEPVPPSCGAARLGGWVGQPVAALDELRRLSRLDPDWSWRRCAVIARDWRRLGPLRAYADLGHKTVLVGQGNKFELWDSALLKEHNIHPDDFSHDCIIAIHKQANQTLRPQFFSK